MSFIASYHGLLGPLKAGCVGGTAQPAASRLRRCRPTATAIATSIAFDISFDVIHDSLLKFVSAKDILKIFTDKRRDIAKEVFHC